MPQATLHLLCGKVAAGKSTLAAELSRSPLTILIKEDQWLSELFGSEIRTFEDYILYSRRIRRVVGPHVQDLLKLGVSVVLDFPANTVVTRSWMSLSSMARKPVISSISSILKNIFVNKGYRHVTQQDPMSSRRPMQSSMSLQATSNLPPRRWGSGLSVARL